MLHFDLTGNATVTSDAISRSRDVEERLRLMLTWQIPTLYLTCEQIMDLREQNLNIYIYKFRTIAIL